MTVEPSTDASLTKPTHWKSIDWIRIKRLVRRLQMRIAKAEQTGRHRKVKSLQWLLTHSRMAKLLAVRIVTTNRGAKTPGVDNVVWRSQRQKLQAAELLNRRGYNPKPLRRHYIPKKNGKLRPLSIPTLYDRAMQALYALALAPIAETVADPYSYGFREGRCCADALEHAHIVLSKRTSPPWVLEGDIRACFDQISQDWLLQHVPMDKQILSKWLKAGYLEKGKWFPTKEGTPQGGLMTPCTHWITWAFLTRRLRDNGDAMMNGDCFLTDVDLLDHQTKDLLALRNAQRFGRFVQAIQKHL